MWSPLLAGTHAAAADEAVIAIAEDIGRLPAAADRSTETATLSGGHAGHAMLFGYLAEVFAEGTARHTADRFLDRAMEMVATTNMDASFYGGFTGIAWAALHLRDSRSEVGAEEIDAALEAHLEQRPWHGDYDLVRGLTGIGVYALERLPHAGGATLLERVVRRLDEIAERHDEGITWLTPPALLPDWQRAICPDGHYNLGVAHGVPGVVVVLAGACSAGIAVDIARPLLTGAVRWFLSRELHGAVSSRFSPWVMPGFTPQPSRSAWCYGDPGIAAALLCAADAMDEPDWRNEALAIARYAANRTPRDAGVRDAGFCHGAAGLGHLFNRMFQASGEACLADASRFWFAQTLAMRKPGTGIGGYRAFVPCEDGAERWLDDRGLLTGSAGIALALLAATHSLEPAWDRMLLVSLAPAREAAQ